MSKSTRGNCLSCGHQVDADQQCCPACGAAWDDYAPHGCLTLPLLGCSTYLVLGFASLAFGMPDALDLEFRVFFGVLALGGGAFVVQLALAMARSHAAKRRGRAQRRF